MVVTERSKAIARGVADALGTRPSVYRWESDHFPDLSADILYAEAWPEPGFHLAMTVNLSDETVTHGETGEELMLCARDEWNVEQVLGDAATRVRRDLFTPAPGAVMVHGMLPTYENLALPHLVAVPPIGPARRITPPEVEPQVAFFQLVPVSDAEVARIEAGGFDRVLAELERDAVDLLDFGRSGT